MSDSEFKGNEIQPPFDEGWRWVIQGFTEYYILKRKNRGCQINRYWFLLEKEWWRGQFEKLN